LCALQLTRFRAEEFYEEHAGKEFFPKLIDFMTSGPVLAMVLSKPNAIADWRKLMGPTNVLKARQEAPRRCGRQPLRKGILRKTSCERTAYREGGIQLQDF